MQINVNIELNDETTNITKMLKLKMLNGIDGKTLTTEQNNTIDKHINTYFSKIIEPIKTFDGVVFQEDKKIIEIFGSVYIQVIEDNNENAWCWDSLNFNNYFMISEINEKGIITVLEEKLRNMVNDKSYIIVNYYYFCLKHNLNPKWNYHITKELLKEKLEEYKKENQKLETLLKEFQKRFPDVGVVDNGYFS